jgi:hypothetical protein
LFARFGEGKEDIVTNPVEDGMDLETSVHG